MTAYSNGDPDLGVQNVRGPMYDWRDGMSESGEVRLMPITPVALFAYPENGFAVLANYGSLTGQTTTRILYAELAYNRPEKGNSAVAPSCALVAGDVTLSDCQLQATEAA